MKSHMFSFVLSIVLLFFLTSELSFAQDRPVRFLEQHKSHFAKAHLKQTEKMLIQHLQNDSTNSKLSAVQAIWELEQIFPTEPFSLFISPLIDIVKNEESEPQLRILSTLALDGLHSDQGDKAIFEASKNTSSKSFKTLCTAISFESNKIAEKND
jgi:hypothetical protein